MKLNDSYYLNMDYIPEEWTREEPILIKNRFLETLSKRI